MKTVHPRINCCVPFCRRGTRRYKAEPGMEWICAKHWPLVDANLKALRRRGKKEFLRRWEAACAHLEAVAANRPIDELLKCPAWGNAYHLHVIADGRRSTFEHGMWRRCKKQAFERAAGI